MSENGKIDKFKKPTKDVITNTIEALLQVTTGVVSTDKKQVFKSIGHLFQSLTSGVFLQSLVSEWNKYKEEGRIEDDYEQTSQHKECLSELLDALDKDLFDELKFSTLRKIFLLAATEEHSNRDDILPQQYLKICRNLSSGELLVLFYAYEFVPRMKESKAEDYQQRSRWNKEVAEKTGLGHSELSDIYLKNLAEKKLIKGYSPHDINIMFSEFNSGHLTELGYNLVKFIEHFDELVKEMDGDENE